MAILLEGKSTCPICHDQIDHSKEYVMFPNITSNTKDPISIFSDATVHVECLKKSILGSLALNIRKRYFEEFHLPNARCVIDGKIIENPQDVYAIGLLSSDEREPLYDFNFTILNRNNVLLWKDRNKFLEESRKFLEAGKWVGVGDFNLLHFWNEKIQDPK